ncbi:MAG: hypothetical protein HC915_05425 [Anaerolineae bacterium]|nr:hypothetical protein [Anaerolineae bacterium]
MKCWTWWRKCWPSAGSREYAIYTSGFSDILNQFEGSAGVQQALRALEGHSTLSSVIEETLEGHAAGEVRVVVGGDGRYNDLNQLSVVIGRYGTAQRMGAITVLGPTRMRYGQAISTVRYVATLLSGWLKDAYGNGSPPSSH